MSSSLYDKDMVWPETVIVGNGDFPSSGIPLGILRRARYVCCCDGAVEQVVSHGIIPDAIAGDGDSLSAEMRERFNGIIHLFDEQDDNDQTKATRFCAANGIRSIAYIGSTGRREDHTLGNISLLIRYMSEFGIEPVMVTDYGYFVPARGSMEFQSFTGECVQLRYKGYVVNGSEMGCLSFQQLVARHSQRGVGRQFHNLLGWILHRVQDF